MKGSRRPEWSSAVATHHLFHVLDEAPERADVVALGDDVQRRHQVRHALRVAELVRVPVAVREEDLGELVDVGCEGGSVVGRQQPAAWERSAQGAAATDRCSPRRSRPPPAPRRPAWPPQTWGGCGRSAGSRRGSGGSPRRPRPGRACPRRASWPRAVPRRWPASSPRCRPAPPRCCQRARRRAGTARQSCGWPVRGPAGAQREERLSARPAAARGGQG